MRRRGGGGGHRSMQLLLDSASVEELQEALNWGVIDGVATNPSLLAHVPGEPAAVLQELCSLANGPVFAEVTSTETGDMIEEGKSLATLDDRIVVRIPCIPPGIPAIAALAEERVRVDATHCFSVTQALLSAKAGARFVSPFVGRLDEAGEDGLTLLSSILTAFDQYELPTRVIASSLKHRGHVAEAARMGADGAAIPLPLLRELADHPLTRIGRSDSLETWRRAQN